MSGYIFMKKLSEWAGAILILFGILIMAVAIYSFMSISQAVTESYVVDGVPINGLVYFPSTGILISGCILTALGCITFLINESEGYLRSLTVLSGDLKKDTNTIRKDLKDLRDVYEERVFRKEDSPEFDEDLNS